MTDHNQKQLSVIEPQHLWRCIADCLAFLDTLTTTTQQLETLKTYEKALMQQLFPSVEAVEA